MRSDRCIKEAPSHIPTTHPRMYPCSPRVAPLLILDTEPVDGNQVGITLSNGTALLVSLDQILLLHPPAYVVLD